MRDERDAELERAYPTHLAHDLVVGVHLPAKACHPPRRRSASEEPQHMRRGALTVSLGIAYLDLQEALRHAIHLLDLHRTNTNTGALLVL